MTNETTDDRTAKALQSWGANSERQAVLAEFEKNPDAPPRSVSTHVDAKSAYTVRTRLARRYSGLVFKVIRTEDGTGQICVKHPNDNRPWPGQPVADQGIDTE